MLFLICVMLCASTSLVSGQPANNESYFEQPWTLPNVLMQEKYDKLFALLVLNSEMQEQFATLTKNLVMRKGVFSKENVIAEKKFLFLLSHTSLPVDKQKEVAQFLKLLKQKSGKKIIKLAATSAAVLLAALAYVAFVPKKNKIRLSQASRKALQGTASLSPARSSATAIVDKAKMAKRAELRSLLGATYAWSRDNSWFRFHPRQSVEFWKEGSSLTLSEFYVDNLLNILPFIQQLTLDAKLDTYDILGIFPDLSNLREAPVLCSEGSEGVFCFVKGKDGTIYHVDIIKKNCEKATEDNPASSWEQKSGRKKTSLEVDFKKCNLLVTESFIRRFVEFFQRSDVQQWCRDEAASFI